MKSNRSHIRGALLASVPVLIGSTTGFVRLTDINNWQHAHGKTIGGVEVRSAKFAQIGDSTIIQGQSGPALSLPTPDAEILAVEMAKSFGYNVTPKTAAGQ